jgi:DNA-binding PucR family transcriptional regulator
VGEIPRGYAEALRALHITSAAEPCIDLRQLGLLRYLACSADAIAQRLARHGAGELGTCARGSRLAVLADTVVCYVECGLNGPLTAERLGVHLNTIHNRLERVAQVLDRAPLGPTDLVELAAAIRICRHAP